MHLVRDGQGRIMALNTSEGFTFTTSHVGDSDVTLSIIDNIQSTKEIEVGTINTTKKIMYAVTDSDKLVDALDEVQKSGISTVSTYDELGNKTVNIANPVTGTYSEVVYNKDGVVTKQVAYDAETDVKTEYELLPDYSYTIVTSISGVSSYVNRFDGTYTNTIYNSTSNTTTITDYKISETTVTTKNASTNSYSEYTTYENGDSINETYNGYDGTTTIVSSIGDCKTTETSYDGNTSYSVFKVYDNGTNTLTSYDSVNDILYKTNVYTTHTESITEYGASGVVVDVKTTDDSTVTKTTQTNGSYTEIIKTVGGTESISYDSDTKITTDINIVSNTTTTSITNTSTGFTSKVIDDGTTITTNINDPVNNTTIYDQATSKTDYKVTTITDPYSGDVSITTSDTVNNKTVLTVRSINQTTQTTTTNTNDGNTQTTLVDDVVNHIVTETVTTPSKTTVNKIITDPNTGLISTVNIETTNAVTTTITVANYLDGSGNAVKKTTTAVTKSNSTSTTVETVTANKSTGVITTVTDNGTKIVTSVYNPTTGKTTTITVKK